MQTDNYLLISFDSNYGNPLVLPTEEGLKLMNILSKSEVYVKTYNFESGEIRPISPDNLKIQFLAKASYDRAKQFTTEEASVGKVTTTF